MELECRTPWDIFNLEVRLGHGDPMRHMAQVGYPSVFQLGL